jgi:hypothetical protein
VPVPVWSVHVSASSAPGLGRVLRLRSSVSGRCVFCTKRTRQFRVLGSCFELVCALCSQFLGSRLVLTRNELLWAAMPHPSPVVNE